MNEFKKVLELISLVFNNYEHVQQLETLEDIIKIMKQSEYSKEYPNDYSLTQDMIDSLLVICKTTHNSIYDYRLFTSDEFKDINNHVNTQLAKYNIKELPSFKQQYYNTL